MPRLPASISPAVAFPPREPGPARILLRSGWQNVNIGDVAHTPGAIRAIQMFAPEVEIALWPRFAEQPERDMFERHLPAVTVVDGHLTDAGKASTPELERALQRADLLLHGSGPHAVTIDDMEAWWRRFRKPFGFFGITVDPICPPTEDTLPRLRTMLGALPDSMLPSEPRAVYNAADVLYTRDSASRDYLRSQGVAPGVLEFGPDATFAFDLREPEVADEILARYGLREGEFLCVVPGVRWTPYYQLREKMPDHEALRREAVNAATADEDMAALGHMMVEWVRRTGMPVLIVPEMSYEMELARRYWGRGLPADVADDVHILPEFWTPAQAATVYSRAHSIASVECHSPIMAIAAGIPVTYVRQPTDTIKGWMYDDLGIGDAVVEMRDAHAGRLTERVLAIHADPRSHRARSAEAHRRALALLEEMTRAAVDAALTA